MSKIQKAYLPLKRIFDILLSLIALILLFPLLIIVAFTIKIDSKGPILFKQKRIGIKNTEFNIFKFRTMRTDAPKNAPTDQLENPEIWITKVGKILRKTSLDELPQLINILGGSMSFVGPRPSLWNQKELIRLREEFNILSLKPGLTGLAQINGRDQNNDIEKTQWDKIYLEEISFCNDCKILIKTIFSEFNSKNNIEGKQSI